MTVTKIIQTLLELTETYELDPSKVEVNIGVDDENSRLIYGILGMNFKNEPDPDQKNTIILVNK